MRQCLDHHQHIMRWWLNEAKSFEQYEDIEWQIFQFQYYALTQITQNTLILSTACQPSNDCLHNTPADAYAQRAS